MSLLKTRKFSPRRRTLLLIAAALLLALPCVAAARFAMSFNAAAIQDPGNGSEVAQKRRTEERQVQERQLVELQQQVSSLKERIGQAPERERTEIQARLREVERNLELHRQALESKLAEIVEQYPADEVRMREAREKLELAEKSDGTRKARLIYHTEPPYPPEAREKNIEGSVIVGFTVNRQGVPEGIQVKRSLYPSLDQAAVEAVSKWRFEPALKDGQPVSMWMEAEVSFILTEERVRRGEAITRDGRTEYQGQEFKTRMSSEAERRAETEREEKQRLQLVREAKISMDQAIQIATSKVPGKVTECSLVGERWSAGGESTKPAMVLYHVVILTGDDANPVTMHVLVNAADGSISKVEKEERKREEQATVFQRTDDKAINGGLLNGKATSLPKPEYPAIARQAQASGQVNVEVLVDEGGNVIAAHAVSGHPLLQSAAVAAARQATFTPTRLSGEPVKVRGILTFNFVVQ